MIRKWHKNNLDKPLTLINGGKQSFRPKTGNSGKPILPIISDAPKSAPLSDEKRAEMLARIQMLDGDSTGTDRR